MVQEQETQNRNAQTIRFPTLHLKCWNRFQQLKSSLFAKHIAAPRQLEVLYITQSSTMKQVIRGSLNFVNFVRS